MHSQFAVDLCIKLIVPPVGSK